MLAMTKSAAEAIRDMIAASGMPDIAGVRIIIEPIDGQTAKLDMSLTEVAEPGDARLEQQGANLFVEETTASMLDGKVLDATVVDEGVEFSVIDSPSDLSSNGQREH